MTINEIRTALRGHTPILAPAGKEGHTHAAVALLVRNDRPQPEVLFILRAEYDGDPWSGNIAFPGGHIEDDDPTPQHTAARETQEELGIDLTHGAEFLGRLDDVAGAHLPVIVSCFVWLVPPHTEIRHNGEVVKAFWVPLPDLADPARQREHRVEFRGETLIRPAIDLLGPGHTVLWGITYRLTSHFMGLIGAPLPHTPIP